ncbi:hypothetical protein F5050DRAFT_1716378 [Lentinula boryana]|uniref:Uncharacterized protein n=1 Tax=Lentinula boryana TaxID=40481 RepID=A0ABQ8PZN1_9AGAR|nr:hypothetical protein F5050DRAFT_1716378 [Lentinula boryana]
MWSLEHVKKKKENDVGISHSPTTTTMPIPTFTAPMLSTPFQGQSSWQMHSQSTCSPTIFSPPTSFSPSPVFPYSPDLDQLWRENTLLWQELKEDKASLKLWRENATLRQRITEVEEQNNQLKAERNAAQAHAVFAGQQFLVYKHKYNQRAMKKRASKRVTVSARVLTSRQGRKEIAAATVKKVKKKKANEEKQKRKNDTLLADVLCQAEQDRLEAVFSGNMKNMPKPQLIDIANALKIPHEKATVDNLDTTFGSAPASSYGSVNVRRDE